MHFKYTSMGAKTYKTLSIILALTVLMSGLGVWYTFIGTSNTVEATTSYLLDKVVVNSDFFDYYYDNEVGMVNHSQGDRKRPFQAFNEAISNSNYATGNSTTESIYTLTFTVDTTSWETKPGNMDIHVWEDGGAVLFNWHSLTGSNGNATWTWTLTYEEAKKVQNSLQKGKTLRFKARANCSNQQESYNFSYPGDSTNYAYNISVNATNWGSQSAVTSTVSSQMITKPGSSTNAIPLYFGQFWIERENGSSYNSTSASQQKAANDGSDDYGNTLTNFLWGANLAFRPLNEISGTDYAQYHAVAQGLVDTYLLGDCPTKNGVKIPYFDKDWISNTKRNVNGTDKAIADYTEGVDFPFSKKDVPASTKIANQDVDGEYYVFDSTKDAVYVNKNGTLTKGGTVYDIQNKVGFFPFNETNPSSKSELNYGFGTRFDISFTISEYGTVDNTENGDAVKFAFKGDDDVWVFLDGQLILDMGGAHKEAEGVIDFKAQQVYISYAASAQTNNIKSDVLSELGITTDKVETFENLGIGDLSEGEHEITMFYMERGMINSNLYVQFNMSVIPNENALTVKNEVNADKVNAGLLAQTLAVADNDVFEYTLSNKGTDKSDVDTTGVLFPTYDYIRRYNTGATGNPLAVLSGKHSTTTTTMDTEHIYLNPGVWDTAGAKFYAWVWGGTQNNSQLVLFEYDSVSDYYRINNYGYTGMQLFRYDPNNPPTSLTTYPNKDDGKCWNRLSYDISISSNKNLFNITGRGASGSDNDWSQSTGEGSGSWNDTSVEITTTTKSQTDNKYLATETGTVNLENFYLVKETNYDLRDPFAQITDDGTNWVDYKDASDTIAGQTSSTGTLNLMYGQSAKFTGQFKKGSIMQVIQSTALNKPSNRGSITNLSTDATLVSFGSGSRTVANYYTTTVSLTGATVSTPTNDQFAYNNNSNEKVNITETFVNEIQTGDLTIIKNVANGDTSDTNSTFTFEVVFSNLFGSTTNVSNYSLIKYDLYSKDEGTWTLSESGKVLANHETDNIIDGGTFTIKPNQKVVIEGIPVGTKYTVTETAGVGDNSNYTYKNTVYSDTNKVISYNDKDQVTVTNERKTGELILAKDVQNFDGSECTDSADKDQAFEFTVTLTAPNGVDLSKYITSGYSSYSAGVMTIKKSVSENHSITISDIPYGTSYVVTESSAEDGWTYYTIDNPNGTITTASTTTTITNRKVQEQTEDAYLTITKYIDSLYYDSTDNAHGFTNPNYSIISGNNTTLDKHGYLKYTNAEQVFTFTVTEYNGDSFVGTYQVLLTFTADAERLTTAKTISGTEYNYCQSKSFKVTAGHTYKITETGTGTGISWRYDFAYAEGSLNGTTVSASNGGSGAVNNTIEFTYAAAAAEAQNAIATFYDKRTTASQRIESDMSSITNTINN